MDEHTTKSASRRLFLRRSSVLGAAGVASGWALNLAAIGEAAAFTGDGYKALVCVFLGGGNDHNNTIVPYDTASYAAYSSIRGGTAGIALPRTSGAGTVGLDANVLVPAVALGGGRQYALAPGMAPLKPLFDAGTMAIQLNVGPLIQPTTRAQYDARSVALPPKLFSHNDQQSLWQSSGPEGATQGWGGRMGDLALADNGGASIFTCVSAGGNAVMLAGASALAYQVGLNGAVAIQPSAEAVYGSTAVRDAMRTLVSAAGSHPLEGDYADVVIRSIGAQGTLNTALDRVPVTTMPRFDATTNPAFATQLAGNGLAGQLRVVARMIAARQTLGVRRQVFMVSLGGFDHHDNLMTHHPSLIGKVAVAMRVFHETMLDLGVADRVVAFTASDFGRTLSSNGDGSDHGWGGHHWVIGGAVNGGRFHGTAPAIEVNGQGDVGGGRLIPTTSVEQYAASLALWFGVAPSELADIFPNYANFGSRPAFL